MNKSTSHDYDRRQFVKTTAAASLASLAASPLFAAESKLSSTKDSDKILGADDHQYRVDHHWAQLPDQFTWQTTHDVAIDSQGSVYIIHEGRLNQPDHPAIFVFDPDGKYLRSFGNQFQGGGHGIEVRNESGDDFLYVCNYQQQRSIAKLTPDGEQLWRQGAPMQSGQYAQGEDQFPRKAGNNPWGRDRFLPTNIAFHPDGGFFVADGYGAYRIHYYDAQDDWVSTFGAPKDQQHNGGGRFNLPHGVWIDDRDPAQPKIVVADRANARLQWFTMLGEHLETLDGFLLPANIDVRGEVMLVPDLVGRVTLLDGDNKVIAHLGDDHQRMQADSKKAIRGDESKWRDGKFVHPHDACFDEDGNIYVAEWVAAGRVSKLTKIS